MQLMMPDCFLCYTPPVDAPAPSPAPSECFGHITFGSFNNVAKINASVVSLWARILCRVPESNILFKSRAFAAKPVKESCSTAFRLAGVDPRRIDMLMVTASTRSHLEAYSRMDISLDTFPYAGTTTTMESLLMGVPVVTLRSRHALSKTLANQPSLAPPAACLPACLLRHTSLRLLSRRSRPLDARGAPARDPACSFKVDFPRCRTRSTRR